MNNDEKIFRLIEKFYEEFSDFKQDMNGFKQDMNDFKQDMNGFKQETKKDLKNINRVIINIEQNHGSKLDALFDGYKQNTEKLSRIEAEVVKHEEFIMKRIK